MFVEVLTISLMRVHLLPIDVPQDPSTTTVEITTEKFHAPPNLVHLRPAVLDQAASATTQQLIMMQELRNREQFETRTLTITSTTLQPLHPLTLPTYNMN